MKRPVVIIEGNAEDRRLFESMLTGVADAAYSVTTASTGDEGLAAIENTRPSCVLLDYSLPGQGSAASWNRIRARYPNLPVVILTGEDVDFEVLESMRTEGQEYLRKSAASPDTLHQAISSAILAAMSGEQGTHAPTVYNVLIIDDNADDREAFIRALKKIDERYTCTEAGEGLAGVAVMEKMHPDCVLLDYSLPALNGLEILKRIHAVDAFLPVIMLTGLGNETVAVQAMKGGAQNYLVKTAVTSSLLHTAIVSAVEHSALERKIYEQRNQIAEQKLEIARTHRLNEAILHTAPYMIVATDLRGTVLAFNPAAERELGYSAGEVIGNKTPLLWLEIEELTRRAAEISAELGVVVEPDFSVLTHKAGSVASQQEWTCVRRGGQRFTANLSITPMRGSKGETTGFLIVAEDITVHKEQQDALKAREELFRGMMEHAPNGMALFDTAGRFLKVNEALCELLGYTPEQLYGKHPEDLTDPEDVEIDLENVRQLLAGKIQSYKVEKRLIREDGSIVHVLLAMSLMHNEDGTPSNFVAQFQDITDRKEMERLKSDFVSMVSHELRTPVTSIRGAIGLLASVAGRDLPPRGHQLMDIANKNCDRLISIVNDMLDIDKVAHGQMNFEMKDEDVAALLQEAIEAHRGYTEKLNIGVVMEPVQTNLMVHVDAARLIQVLFNLLSNATKHSPEGGQIRVGAGRVGGQIRVWVRDQGPGIEEEFAKHLFEKFSQASAADVRGTRGSGLGLHISKQIIEQMGGRIGLDTKLGLGSTFWIDLPETTPVEASTPVERSDRTKRILVCEDDDNLATVIKMMLSKQGFEADIVHNVPEARRKLMTGAYDAMTLDVTLPLGDGLALAREVHGQAGTSTLPIVVVSARFRDERADLERAAGIVDWIVKPFDKERLLRSIEKAASEPLKLVHSA
jgi:PAS domain S-box-containing protein